MATKRASSSDPPHVIKMISKTVQRDQDIDLEAIAKWSNEGGAAGPLKRGANRLRLYEALIPMRGVNLNQYCAALVQKDTEFHGLVAKTEAGKRVWRHRKHQLGNRVADAGERLPR